MSGGYQPPIDPAAQSYYDRTTLAVAIQATKERIDEWDYLSDPHGYCHERPALLLLVRAAEEYERSDP